MWYFSSRMTFCGHLVFFYWGKQKNKSNPVRKELKETIFTSLVDSSVRGKIRNILVFFN